MKFNMLKKVSLEAKIIVSKLINLGECNIYNARDYKVQHMEFRNEKYKNASLAYVFGGLIVAPDFQPCAFGVMIKKSKLRII